MSNKAVTMTDADVAEMQQRIDDGILLAQKRLVSRAMHDNLKLVVCRNGKVQELPATEFNIK